MQSGAPPRFHAVCLRVMWALLTASGHVFHAPCVRDWLENRSHGAVANGCPLCKAVAPRERVLELWPVDASDFNQYVAAHHRGALAAAGRADPMLAACCEFLYAVQGYVMAAHGIRAKPMRSAQEMAAAAMRRGAVTPEHAADELQVRKHYSVASTNDMQHAMRALADMAASVQDTSDALGRRSLEVEARAAHAEREHAALAAQRRALEERSAAIAQERRHVREKRRTLHAERAAVEERGAALTAREAQLIAERAAESARMQESVAGAKSASAEAIRRAALREEACSQQERAAAEHVRAADERAAEAQSALAEIRLKNQRMADQMRELQTALRTARERRRESRTHRERDDARLRAEAARSQRYRERVRALEEELAGTRSVSPDAAGGSSPPLPPSLASSSPSLGTPEQRTPRGAKRLLEDELDDARYPMPGGVLEPLGARDENRPVIGAPRPAAAPGTLDALWRPNVSLVLGPKRRPKG